MVLVEFGLNLLAALGIGALVGLEREHTKDGKAHIAGIRTFPLVSAAGFLTIVLAARLSEPMIAAAGVLGISLLAIALIYVRHAIGAPGLTTPMALEVTFLAGMLVGAGLRFEAILVGVVVTFVLVTKRRLHGLARNLDDAEMLSAIQFVAVAFVLLPLAASLRGPYLGGLIGRGAPLDPVWTIVIVIAVSLIGFASFLALRAVGPRHGFLVSGGLGGLINSEAATVSIANLAQQDRRLHRLAVGGVLAATTTMLGRNVVLAAIAAPRTSMPFDLGRVLVPMALITGVAAHLASRRADDGAELDLKNPFALGPALKFAVVFTVVNAVAWWLSRTYGDVGVYVATIGAVVSAGAVVASVSALAASGSITVQAALIAAALASFIGVLTKAVIASAIHHPLVGRMTVPLLLALVAGGVSLAMVLAGV